MGILRGNWLLLPILALLATRAQALETEECRLSSAWLPAISADCGTLSVPENPAEPNGRHIEIFIARVPSLNAAPRPDPVVLISGGPGQGTADMYLMVRGGFQHVRRDRDIILVDQRGTGRSGQLACDFDDGAIETAEPDELPLLMRQCLEQFEDDPRFYTTSVAVQDLDLVREELGLEEWNVYGVSYGTRVAQHYARRFPHRVRAMVLDGVVPMEIALGPNVAINAQRALTKAFSRCAVEADCADRFPNLESQLGELRNRLEAGSVNVGLSDPRTGVPVEMELTVLHALSAIRLLSYSPKTVALLPLLISEAHLRNYAPLTAQAYMIFEQLESMLNVSMHNSVVCTEDLPFFPATLTDTSNTYLGSTVVDALRAVCSVWPTGIIDQDLKEPFQSDRPTLILSGEADPITPPEYGFDALSGLSNARHLVGTGQGHGQVSVGCVPQLMRQFFEEADPANLEAECLQQEQPNPFFLDFNGPAP